MEQKMIWMAVVNQIDEIVFCRACRSEHRAEEVIVNYLRRNENFDGKKIDEAQFWICDRDLQLNLLVFPMQLDDFAEVLNRLTK